MERGTSPLLVDLYELTMAQAYLDAGLQDSRATFSLFFRSLPPGWGYVLAAGLDDVLRYLEGFRFSRGDLGYLEETGRFTPALLSYLEGLRFTGDVRAMREGTPFFPVEPVLEVDAALIEGQLVETVVINLVHYQSLVAGKAARCVDAAEGRRLAEFGLRRTHGLDAGLKAGRASYLAGFDATSDVLAGKLYGIPLAGTMAHSFVESFSSELEAFRAFARSYPDDAILLVDTHDTLEGVRRAAVVGRELAERGSRLQGVRLDSGDLAELSRRARAILDEAGLDDAIVFVSGGLDERDIARLLSEGAPIDGFGIGTKLTTSADAPSLDMAYKLVELDGRPTLKVSAGKASLPGAKQVWRTTVDGQLAGDVVELARAPAPEGAEPLLHEVMRDGTRVESEPLAVSRERAAAERSRLPATLRTLRAGAYDVLVGPVLAGLRDELSVL